MSKSVSRVELVFISLYVAGVVITATWQITPWATWFASSNVASWVQALGSIVAIFVAIEVTHRQHKSALEIQQRIERDRQILMCTRALLVGTGLMSALQDYARVILSKPGSAGRPFAFFWYSNQTTFVQMDLDSLAFLIGRDAGQLLNDFSALHANDRRWSSMLRTLGEFGDKDVDPPLLVERKRLGRGLSAEEMITAAGPMAYTELLMRTADIERFAVEGLAKLPETIESLRSRVQILYPEARLPELWKPPEHALPKATNGERGAPSAA